MHIAASLLLNAVRIAGARRDTNATLAVLPREDILDLVLAELPMLDAQVAQKLLELASLAQGSDSTVALLAAVADHAPALKAGLGDPAYADRLHALDRHLATLLAINHIAGPASPNRGALMIDSLDLLRYIERLQIADSGNSHTILIGTPISENGCIIRLPGPSYIAQRVTITYHSRADYPRLNLTTPTLSAYDDRPQQREMWVQKPLPSYNLDIYTYKDRLMGRVTTQLVPTFPAIFEQHLRLAFAPQIGAQFLVTEIRDDLGALLARCIKIILAASLAA
jgi:hypothetical protein